MHVLHRPHLPRLISVSVAAFTLATTISLLLATSVSTISRFGDNARTPAHLTAPAPRSALHTNPPPWASNPPPACSASRCRIRG